MEYYNDFETLVDEVFNEFFNSLTTCEQVYLWNEYCEHNNMNEEYIYEMYELDEIFYGIKPTELLDKLNSDFKSSDNYFKDAIYGLESFDYPDDYIDIDDLKDWFKNEYSDIEDNDEFRNFCEENEYDLEENRDEEEEDNED